MKKYSSEELSEILDKLSDEMKNTLIRMLLKYDKKDVDIVSIPIYHYITDANNVVIGQTIIANKYDVSVTHKADEYREHDFIYEISYVDKDYTYHIVKADKDNFEETIYKIFTNGGFYVKITCTYIDKE